MQLAHLPTMQTPGNPRMDGRVKRRHRSRRPGARALFAGAAFGARAPEQHRHAVLGQYRLCQFHRADQEERCPGNIEIEERLRAYMRWNAMAMVVKANRHHPEDGGDLGGHIGSFASLAHMFGAGFNHFWHAESKDHGGDCIYIQGHVAPGVYARAYLEGRLTEEQLLHFRQETGGKGLSSYPHPKLMPEFWQFPTVSMGLGPLMAIYQARFLKYLHARGIANTANRKVWVFCGDGEMDEVESLGAIGLAAREKLDNLVFVINCNLQRLDGPVRGNGKIIQELEGTFRGAGWNVIKLIWGSEWDPLLARDKDGALRKVMMDTLDGDYQTFKSNDGAYVRKHFFGRSDATARWSRK
jgi:pyruvate dehydrogenase E1 component